MSINWNEMNSHGRMLVEQRRQEAEMHRLAKIATEQAGLAKGQKQPQGWMNQLMSRLVLGLR
jgi:hypothetical protein